MTVFKQKQTRVDGALGTGHAYRVTFENGEPARNGVFGRQNCTVKKTITMEFLENAGLYRFSVDERKLGFRIRVASP